MNRITKAQKKDALRKVAAYAGDKIRRHKFEERYTFSEIAAMAGLRPPRISDITRNGIMPEKVLAGLISGGIVTRKEILRKMKSSLSEKQTQYIEDFVVYEMKRFKRLAVELLHRGDNPEKVLEKFIIKEYGEEVMRSIDAK